VAMVCLSRWGEVSQRDQEVKEENREA